MGSSEPAVYVTEDQYEMLSCLESFGELSVEKLASLLKKDASSLMRDLAELESKKLVRVARRKVKLARPTQECLRYAELGLPELRVARVLLSARKASLEELPKVAEELGVPLTAEEARLAVSYLAKSGLCSVSRGVLELVSEDVEGKLADSLRLEEDLKKLRERGVVPAEELENFQALKKRKLVEVKEKSEITVHLSPFGRAAMVKGAVKVEKLITRLTPELIASGAWREGVFKRYNLALEVPTVYPARKHPYMQVLDMVREVLANMGFEEVKGPHVELEFWNFDALFQAQDHPVRDMHDSLYLKDPKVGDLPDEDLVTRVRKTHENGWITGSKGWRYPWRAELARRLILRTHTTSVSAREIYRRGEQEYRLFSLDRVFRRETLDPSHSMEFYQLEGIIVGEKVTFKHLLGFFVELNKALGLGELKFKPAYFPYTEPSVEGYIRHPKLGWIEVYPGGLFRPEVVAPLGLKRKKVAAWGIGIDRIAMTVLGIDDIRLLFTQDVSFVRSLPVPKLYALRGG